MSDEKDNLVLLGGGFIVCENACSLHPPLQIGFHSQKYQFYKRNLNRKNCTSFRDFGCGDSFPSLPSPVLSCRVLSCPVLSCPVVSCPVLSCPVLSCPVLSCPAAAAAVAAAAACIWFSYGFHMVSYGFHMVLIIWKPYGNHMKTIRNPWVSYAFVLHQVRFCHLFWSCMALPMPGWRTSTTLAVGARLRSTMSATSWLSTRLASLPGE